MTCQYLKGGHCEVAEAAAFTELELRLSCMPTETACLQCLSIRAPSHERPSVQAMALVTKQVSGEKQATWIKFFEHVLLRKSRPWKPKQKLPVATKPKGSRGLGDTIAKATKAVGIKPCGGCKKRQEWLNKIVPYGTDNS